MTIIYSGTLKWTYYSSDHFRSPIHTDLALITEWQKTQFVASSILFLNNQFYNGTTKSKEKKRKLVYLEEKKK